jgi:hypothetical protein
MQQQTSSVMGQRNWIYEEKLHAGIDIVIASMEI